jgi:hypothetical protein
MGGGVTEKAVKELIDILRDARVLLQRPGNDYAWSGWDSPEEGLGEIDSFIARLERGVLPESVYLEVLFAPTGPVQEVSLSGGWEREYMKLADRFDAAITAVYGAA